MIPTTNEILAQIILLWGLRNEAEPIKPITMGAIGSELMYPPLFIINALDLGKKLGLLKHDYKTDEVEVIQGSTTNTYMGAEVQDLMNAFVQKIGYENALGHDMNLGLLQQWCVGVRPSAAEMGLKRLILDGVLVTYDLADPKDKKSVYTFYTLKENEGEQWGTKQFANDYSVNFIYVRFGMTSRQKEWYYKNKERSLANDKKWRKANPEKRSEINRRYRESFKKKHGMTPSQYYAKRKKSGVKE